jgi:hypothetical protein
METEYKEIELPCIDTRFRRFQDQNGYEWFTDPNQNFLGESLQEAISASFEMECDECEKPITLEVYKGNSGLCDPCAEEVLRQIFRK